MSSFLVGCSICSLLLVLVSPALAARVHTPSPKAGTAECAAMLRQAYECKVEIRRLSRSQMSMAGNAQADDLAARETACDQWQDRYVAFCRK